MPHPCPTNVTSPLKVKWYYYPTKWLVFYAQDPFGYFEPPAHLKPFKKLPTLKEGNEGATVRISEDVARTTLTAYLVNNAFPN